ncbi:MAG: ABC transporter ATP-binding protein [Rhodobacteraceae bacterium]|nr:ABC transporter ATP-binding protein [Paracoccaceae bacterium]
MTRIRVAAPAAARKCRKRIGIARVLILAPRLVIADEPVSALDVSIQVQVLDRTRRLQRDSGTSMWFVSHDLGAVRHMSGRVAVMYGGRLVEAGMKRQIFETLRRAYTQRLLASIPRLGKRIG